MDKLISKLTSSPFSDQDIRSFVSCKVIPYEELSRYDTIDEVLSRDKCAIILYQIREDFGHWVAINKIHDNIEFFDSYGYRPDEEFKFAKFNKKPYLTRLLIKSPYQIIYNPYKLQKDGFDMNTCGRWVVLRILMKDIPIKTFSRLFLGQSKKPDWYATALTMLANRK
jgi:hypothetical protein